MRITTHPATRATRAILLLAPLAAVAVVAGCGASKTTGASAGSTSPGTNSPPATVTDTVQPPTSTATTTVVTGPQPCATSNLTVSLATGNGAAGSTYYPLRFVNKGSASCTITGFPGVSFVAPNNGSQVGAAGTRSGDAGSTVTLASGSTATAVVQVATYANFDPNTCKATAVSGLRVYPPGNTDAAYVAFPNGNQMACSGDLSSTGSTELSVTTTKAGTGS